MFTVKNTTVEKPPYRRPVLFWYPPIGWHVGKLFETVDSWGDYFQGVGYGALYLADGPTFWCELPPKPIAEE